MKKGILACVVASVAIGNPLSFNYYESSGHIQSSISGRVYPADGAVSVYAIAGKDSISTAVVWGNFSLQVKPGSYRLVVNAKSPYKNVSVGNLEVKRDHVLNIGEIILQK